MYNHPNTSKIIELELEITSAIINGHRPSADDQYEEKRKELERLRREIELEKNKPRLAYGVYNDMNKKK